MPGSKIARRIDVTGWSTVGLGALCVGLSVLQVAIPIVLLRLADTLDEAGNSGKALRDAWSADAGSSAALNALFGLALIVIGFAVSRRARWAHPALEITCWASVAVLALLARPSLAPFFVLAGRDSAPGMGMLVAAAGLLVLQIAAVLWFLRFWRKPEVRAAFRDH